MYFKVNTVPSPAPRPMETRLHLDLDPLLPLVTRTEGEKHIYSLRTSSTPTTTTGWKDNRLCLGTQISTTTGQEVYELFWVHKYQQQQQQGEKTTDFVWGHINNNRTRRQQTSFGDTNVNNNRTKRQQTSFGYTNVNNNNRVKRQQPLFGDTSTTTGQEDNSLCLGTQMGWLPNKPHSLVYGWLKPGGVLQNHITVQLYIVGWTFTDHSAWTMQAALHCLGIPWMSPHAT